MDKGKRYTADEKAAIVAEFNLSDLSLFAFSKLDGKPPYPTLKKWIEGASTGNAPSTRGKKGDAPKEESVDNWLARIRAEAAGKVKQAEGAVKAAEAALETTMKQLDEVKEAYKRIVGEEYKAD